MRVSNFVKSWLFRMFSLLFAYLSWW